MCKEKINRIKFVCSMSDILRSNSTGKISGHYYTEYILTETVDQFISVFFVSLHHMKEQGIYKPTITDSESLVLGGEGVNHSIE